eukprot:COSAG06_NODE_50322_length_319_cov_1.172727_1_plen_93_part_10
MVGTPGQVTRVVDTPQRPDTVTTSDDFDTMYKTGVANANKAADASALGKSDALAGQVMDGAKAVGDKLGMLGKAAGLAGGLFAAGDDAMHGFK